MAARFEPWGCDRSLAGVAVSNPAGAWMSLVSVLCCHVEVSASGWSLVQRHPTECGVSECDREASIMRRSWHTGGCRAMKKIQTLCLRTWARLWDSVVMFRSQKDSENKKSLGNTGLHEFLPWSSCKLTCRRRERIRTEMSLFSNLEI